MSPRASIMVLPFRNASNDPEQDYLVDAVTDDLTTDLSRLSDTAVIAPATAFTYKGKAVDPREIGREFKVRYLLQGSIRKTGMKVQTNAQLVETPGSPIFPSSRTLSPAESHPRSISSWSRPRIVAPSLSGQQTPMPSI